MLPLLRLHVSERELFRSGLRHDLVAETGHGAPAKYVQVVCGIWDVNLSLGTVHPDSCKASSLCLYECRRQ